MFPPAFNYLLCQHSYLDSNHFTHRIIHKSKSDLFQGGSGGKWQTPHQKEKLASRGSGKIELGNQGIWATCARNQEGRATEELKAMFEEVSEQLYSL